MTVHFVTGATGAIGSATVARLLQEPIASVIALVRDESPQAAAARLDATLSTMGVREPVCDGIRVRVACGDVEQPRFGLSDNDYDNLVRTCTHMIHCAGAVRMNLPIEAARHAAVASARNFIRLAQQLQEGGRLVKAEMISTVGVAGRDHGLLREDWVGASHAFHNTYEQAKAEAEVEIRKAIDAGLPITVHRPSMVVGDSKTGRALHFQVFYFLVDFLSGRPTRGIFPDLGNARLDIIPVDFVAEAIVRSSRSPTTSGRILHLCAGPQHAISLHSLQATVRDALHARGDRIPRVRFIPRRIFRHVAHGLGLVVDKRTRAALATLPVFLDYLETDQTFDNVNTERWLEGEGVVLPRVQDHLPHVLEFYFATQDEARIEAKRLRRTGA